MNNKQKNISEKIRFKYKISILNENTLEETHSTNLSLLNVIVAAAALLFIIFFFYSVVILYTPLRNYLPTYSSSEVRDAYIRNTLLADSLERMTLQHTQYINMLKDIAAGRTPADSVTAINSPADDTTAIPFTETSDEENDYLTEYEKEEKEYYQSLKKQSQTKSIFNPPAHGRLTSSSNSSQGRSGINIRTHLNAKVSASLGGSVLCVGKSSDGLQFIAISHSNGYITIYSGLSEIFVSKSQKLHSGQAIGLMSPNKKNATTLHFEIWRSDKQLNPNDFITVSQ